MQNEKQARPWGIVLMTVAGLAILFLVLMISGAVSVTSSAQTREIKAKSSSISVQWQPQSYIEARFHARLAHDVKILKKKLEELAAEPACPDPDAWAKHFANHFLKSPRLWADGELKEQWVDVLPRLYEIVKGSKDICVDFAWGMLEYVPYDNVKKPKPEEDVDFIFKVKVTFSASPGDNILEGALKHRRVSEIGS